ncbi:MAG: tyrosine--tRNA ligase [Thermoplasmata archaeon]|nr:tyrosine--tRNA ligase [Thermoplasmata archaeon]
MDLEERALRVTRHTAEVLTPEEIRSLFERESAPRAYIGFEPSGLLHVGHLVTARKMRDLTDAGCRLTVFLADWHAWINDKLGGSLEKIRACGQYMQSGFVALGVDPSRTEFRWAQDLQAREGYWDRVVRVAKATSLARSRRALPIMGRAEEETNLDTAKLFYPSMQAADIFELPVEIAYAGVDQRRAHVLAREVAHHYHWPVPVAVHTSLISSLKGGGRMDPESQTVERKMSKSDPGAGLPLPSEPEVITSRIDAAYCPAKEVDGNPLVELVRFVIFPWEGQLAIERAAKHGGPVVLASEEEFLATWRAGSLHPQDLKTAVALALTRITEPANRFFRSHPEAIPAALRPGGAGAA